MNDFQASSSSNPFALDPFVARPKEMDKAGDQPTEQRVNRNLEALQNLGQQLASGEVAGRTLAEPAKPAKPTVEVIGAEGKQETITEFQVESQSQTTQPPCPAPGATPEPAKSNEIPLNVSVVNLSEVTFSREAEFVSVVDELPPWDPEEIPSVSAIAALETPRQNRGELPIVGVPPEADSVTEVKHDHQAMACTSACPDGDGLEIDEFRLALDVLPTRQDSAVDRTQQASPQTAPIQPQPKADLVSGEPVFDVRDFVTEQDAETNQSPVPIARAFEFDPETFDYYTGRQLVQLKHAESKPKEDLAKSDSRVVHAADAQAGDAIQSQSNPRVATQANEPGESEPRDPNVSAAAWAADVASPAAENVFDATEESETLPAGLTRETQDQDLFLAENDQVIVVDGNDGFDSIDLSCFALSVATFLPNLIQINDPATGSFFSVKYRNVKQAVFADDVTINLVVQPAD